MKSMPWLKLHTELRTDPKLRALTGVQHRIWFNLLCFASDMPTRGVIASIPMDLLAVEVALGELDDLTETLKRLQVLRIISVDADGGITFCDFSERQYEKASDKPEATVERKRRSRTPQPKTLTLMDCETHMSRDVTPCHAPETESKTEKELKKETETNKTNRDECAANDAVVVVPDVVSSLREFGVTDFVAFKLAQDFPTDRIKKQVTWLPQRNPTINPAGMLRRSIEQCWDAPFCVTRNTTLSPPQTRLIQIQKTVDWVAPEMPSAPRPPRDVCEERWFLLSPDVQAALDADARARFKREQSALAPRLSDPHLGRGVRNLLTHYRHQLMIERGFVTDYA